MLTHMLVNTAVSKSDHDQLSCSLSVVRLSCLPCLFVAVAIVLVRASVNHHCTVFKLVSIKLWSLFRPVSVSSCVHSQAARQTVASYSQVNSSSWWLIW